MTAQNPKPVSSTSTAPTVGPSGLFVWAGSWRRYAVCALPLLTTLLVVNVYNLCREVFLNCNPLSAWTSDACKPITVLSTDSIVAVPSPQETVAVSNALSAGRYLWSAFTSLHLSVCLAALLTGALVLRNLLRTSGPRQRVRALLAIAIAALLLIGLSVALAGALQTGSPGRNSTTTQLVQATIARSGDFRDFQTLVKGLETLSLATAYFLAVVAGVTLLPLPDRTEVAALHLARRSRYLNVVLYAGTLVLVTAVLQWSALNQWALASIPGSAETLRESVTLFTSNFTTGRGVYYTQLLAGSYLPAAAVLHLRARRIAETGAGLKKPQDQDTWLKDQGLAASPQDQITRILALIAPLVAGPLAELLKLS